MVRQHHRLNGHESEQTLGDGEGQRSLEYCNSWGCKDSAATERLRETNRDCKKTRAARAGNSREKWAGRPQGGLGH